MLDAHGFLLQAQARHDQPWVSILARTASSGGSVAGHTLLAVHVRHYGQGADNKIEVFHLVGKPAGGSVESYSGLFYSPYARVERYHTVGNRTHSTPVLNMHEPLFIDNWANFMEHNHIISTNLLQVGADQAERVLHRCRQYLRGVLHPHFSLLGGQIGMGENCCAWALRVLETAGIHPDGAFYRWSFLSPRLAVTYGGLH